MDDRIVDEHEILQKEVVDKLREKHREEQLMYREKRRDFFLSKARFLEGRQKLESLTNQDMSELAKSLKNKGSITCELLITVMNGLLDGTENITKFLRVDGALQALLRLLSGQNEKFQLIAAQCICNLALGDEKQSLQVLKASESYLIAHLTGRNHYIAEACMIALGNLSRQSVKNIELLMNQGFFTKIINTLSNGDADLEAAAVYALSQLVYHGFDILRPEDAEICLEAILKVFRNRIFAVAFLLSVLSSCEYLHNQLIAAQLHLEALRYLLIALKEGEKEALYFLRLVSNLICEESGNVARDLIESHGYTFQECLTLLLKSEKDYLIKECLGLIGNMVNHPNEGVKMFAMQLVREKWGLFHGLQLKKLIKSSSDVIS